jgi:hypothetical protein
MTALVAQLGPVYPHVVAALAQSHDKTCTEAG